MSCRPALQAAGVLVAVIALAGADWLRFRGNDHTSVAEGPAPPTQFNVGIADAPTENVAWRVDLPGEGVSGAIVVDGRVIVTCSSGSDQARLHIICFDATDGHKRWERQFWATGRTLCHETSAVAAPTPASDGERIYAFFSSNDLFCLDLDGNLQWLRGLTFDFPEAANDVGMASSPLVLDGTVIVQVETLNQSFAAGIDALTGMTRWQQDRKQAMNWCSPGIDRSADGHDLVLLQSDDRLSAHDPATGRQVWSYDKTCEVIPSPVGADGVVYVVADQMTALRPTETGGEVEELWTSGPLKAGSSSPAIAGGRIYSINRTGTLTCGDLASGEVLWRSRTKGRCWATPVVVGDLLYTVNQDGLMQVVRLGDNGEIVAENDFGEPIFASPAIVDGAMYVRSDRHLWKIAAAP